MKKVLLLITFVFALISVSAQEIAVWESYLDSSYVITPVLVEDIERIAYEKDSANIDIMVMYMKDGSEFRPLSNNRFASLDLDNGQFAPYDMSHTTETWHRHTYRAEWNVSNVWNKDGRYTVGIFWQGLFRQLFKNARYGICIGTSPELTIENSDRVVFVEDSAEQEQFYNRNFHYMFIGDNNNIKDDKGYIWMPISDRSYWLNKWYYDNSWKFYFVDSIENQRDRDVLIGEDNWLKIPLEYGKTYYYRTFSQGDVLQHGEMKPFIFYDVEKSFRVPFVMEDAGYYTDYLPTEDALEEFSRHFPDSVTVPTWNQLLPLWEEWLQTNMAKQVDLSVVPYNFDNGTAYDLKHIPDEFYTWLASREVVIDAFDGLVGLSKYYDKTSKDSVFSSTAERVSNVDPKWGVPGGKYIRFEPMITTVSPKITYRSNEVIPGVRYKLQVNFAPETDEDASPTYFRPTKLKVRASSGQEYTLLTFGGAKYIEVPATEATTYVIDDFETTAMGLNLQYENNVSISEMKLDSNKPDKIVYNRILRIAEIRLIPIIELP